MPYDGPVYAILPVADGYSAQALLYGKNAGGPDISYLLDNKTHAFHVRMGQSDDGPGGGGEL